MSSRMRVTKGHTGNRRSHHKIVVPQLSVCSNCGEYHRRHNICKACGFYRGRAVRDGEMASAVAVAAPEAAEVAAVETEAKVEK